MEPTEISSPHTTLEMTRVAAARLTTSAVRRARAFGSTVLVKVRARRTLWALALPALVVMAVAFGRGRADRPSLEPWLSQLPSAQRDPIRAALSRSDRLGAWALAREASLPLDSPPAAAMLRAELALDIKEPLDALDALEQAMKLSATLPSQPAFVRLSIQSASSGRNSRVQALLARVPREVLEPALRAAATDWNWRVRHTALDALRLMGVANPDEVGGALADLWQSDSCERRRTLANWLVTYAAGDARVAPTLEAVSRRDPDACLAGIVARRAP